MFRFLQSIKSFLGGGAAPQQPRHGGLEDTYAAVAFAERGEHALAERDILGAVQRDSQARHSLGALLQDVDLKPSHAWYGHVVV